MQRLLVSVHIKKSIHGAAGLIIFLTSSLGRKIQVTWTLQKCVSSRKTSSASPGVSTDHVDGS